MAGTFRYYTTALFAMRLSGNTTEQSAGIPKNSYKPYTRPCRIIFVALWLIAFSASAWALPSRYSEGGSGWDEETSASALSLQNRRGRAIPGLSTSPTLGQVSLGLGQEPQGIPVENAGNSTFHFAIPLLRLPGRGLDLALATYYDSGVWHEYRDAQNQRTFAFDLQADNIAPGFSIGFGRIIRYNRFINFQNRVQSLLIDPDGGVHQGTVVDVTPVADGISSNWRTTDGSFIDYNFLESRSGRLLSAHVVFPNGIQVAYQTTHTSGAEIYPTRIQDNDGNYISINYRPDRAPQIETITDTLGRVITFHYDAVSRLTAITAPGLTEGRRTVARFHHRVIDLRPNFDEGQAVITRGARISVLDAVWFPDSNTGYWLGEAYSPYGMLTRVSRQRGMVFAEGPLNEQGTILPGVMTHEVAYNYPAGDTPLRDLPSYTEVTETWTRGGDEGFDSAVTRYSVNRPNRRVTTTRADGQRRIEVSREDGLPIREEIRNSGDRLLRAVTTEWEQGDYASSRPRQIETTNELGQTSARTFAYRPRHNQVEIVRELDFDGTTILRSTRTAYLEEEEYVDAHMFNLPIITELFQGDLKSGQRVARTEYIYDGRQPIPTSIGVANHNQDYAVTSPEFDNLVRGHITQIRRFVNASDPDSVVIQDHVYDDTGNLREILNSNCCAREWFHYDQRTQYAYSTIHSFGSGTTSALLMTEEYQYDFNTGLLTENADPAGRRTVITYDPVLLRPRVVSASRRSLPAGGPYTYYEYDDADLSMRRQTYFTRSTGPWTLAEHVVTRNNGRGQVRRVEALAEDNGWDVVRFFYDGVGRAVGESVPGRGYPSLRFTRDYDALDRVVRVTAPDGVFNVSLYYNRPVRPSGASNLPGETVQVGGAGSERWMRNDVFGRLAEVIEPNPDGGGVFDPGHLRTSYAYTAAGQIERIEQGQQVREFSYDFLGRLLRQALPEKSRALDQVGRYIGSGGGQWTDVFTYDARSNLTSHTDARGVRTAFIYDGDPLDRLQRVEYSIPEIRDTSNPILPVSPVQYSYVSEGDITRLNRVGWAAQGYGGEVYGYDDERRLAWRSVETLPVLGQGPGSPFRIDYRYDEFGRPSEVDYPTQYDTPGAPRKTVRRSYGQSGRLTRLDVDGAPYARVRTFDPARRITDLAVGDENTAQLTEVYGFDPVSGLPQNQRVLRSGTPLLDLAYTFRQPLSGRVSVLSDLLAGTAVNYQYDRTGRLRAAFTSSAPNSWTQQYRYDRYGNRTEVISSGSAPRDGLTGLVPDPQTNRISNNGFSYDAAGNLTRGLAADGTTWQRYSYDAAGRLAEIRNDAGQLLERYSYGSDRRRLTTQYGESTSPLVPVPYARYVWDGDTVVAEYRSVQGLAGRPGVRWERNLIYFGGRLLATNQRAENGETVTFHHPDRLGTRLVTDATGTAISRQTTLPFGTLIEAPSTPGTPPRFTSYDRSTTTGLDYALNRIYAPQQGRFMQPDPLYLGGGRLDDPQSLNLYAYVRNDPVNYVEFFWASTPSVV